MRAARGCVEKEIAVQKCKSAYGLCKSANVDVGRDRGWGMGITEIQLRTVAAGEARILGQHAVLPLPRYSQRPLGWHAVPTLPFRDPMQLGQHVVLSLPKAL